MAAESNAKLLLSLFEKGLTPPRATWPNHAMRVARPGRSAEQEADLIWVGIAPNAQRAWRIVELLDNQRKLPREIHYAYDSWSREWTRWRDDYVDWRSGWNREERRHHTKKRRRKNRR